MSGMTLVGLGPGSPDQITVEARAVLTQATEIWVTAPDHPVVAALPPVVTVRELHTPEQSLPVNPSHHPEGLSVVVDLMSRREGVVIALPGHPLIDSALGRAAWLRAAEMGVESRLVGAPSLVDALMLGMPGGAADTFVCSARSLEKAHVPPFPPNLPALITGVETSADLRIIQAVLQTTYPPEHGVVLYRALSGSGQASVALRELTNVALDSAGVCVYVPPLAAGTSLEALQEVVAHLRAPQGCPWDRKQTHSSLRPHLLEEAYETLAAMDSGNPPALQEELGDLLLQIMMNAQIASEAGDFTLNDVARSIHDKLIRRHPHVFGELRVDDVDGVLANWERLKEDERAEKGAAGGLLDGVPAALPALGQAQEYQDRASRVGFDWPQISGVLEKVAEEVREVQEAIDADALTAELGDLLFSLVNLSRWKGVDAESALREANQRFKRRFGFVEAAAQRDGRRLSQLSLPEMDALWDQAKASDLTGAEGE
jgi:tetrapyrrole methylase family protein / MazG family protein